MRDFDYVAPSTVEEAVAACAGCPGKARVLAGGTDLLVQLREELREADLIVDVKRIPELVEIRLDGSGSLTLGAATPCHRIWEDEGIVASWPALSDAARIIGAWQIQGRASVGGNLCNASPAADSIPASIVEGAVCVVAGPTGRREVPASEFCVAPGKTVLARDEILVALRLPAPEPRTGSRYVRFTPRNEMDIAVVGAGAWLRLDASAEKVESARIALGAVAPTPVVAEAAAEWLRGKPATEESFRTAGELAREVARPISDHRGPAEFRKHLAGVLVRRALVKALDRARGGDRRPEIPVGAAGMYARSAE